YNASPMYRTASPSIVQMSRRSVYAGSHARRKPRTRKGTRIQRFFVSSCRPLEMLPLVNVAAIGMRTVSTAAPSRPGLGLNSEKPPHPKTASRREMAGVAMVMSPMPHFGKGFMISVLRSNTPGDLRLPEKPPYVLVDNRLPDGLKKDAARRFPRPVLVAEKLIGHLHGFRFEL